MNFKMEMLTILFYATFFLEYASCFSDLQESENRLREYMTDSQIKKLEDDIKAQVKRMTQPEILPATVEMPHFEIEESSDTSSWFILRILVPLASLAFSGYCCWCCRKRKATQREDALPIFGRNEQNFPGVIVNDTNLTNGTSTNYLPPQRTV